ncbi:HalOD1 output domain-containing protein [Halorubrum sp. DTA46]|uniref:HalOD1 output domain-containing protein n=1 Tax=Halorubrum sp. DTA46 TaxID=3402162 RepID=UPI003AAE5172
MTPPDSPREEDEDLRTAVASDAYTSKIPSDADRSPTVCVVEAVSEAIDTDLTELQPLYDAIDPDALDQLIGPPHRFTGGRIRFRYEGCTVTVDADGWIAVSSGLNDGA